MVHPPNNYGSETGGRTPQRPEWLETGALYWGRPSKPALQGSTRLPEQPHAHFQHRASQTTQAQQSLQHPVTSYGWPPEKRRRIEMYGAMPAQGSRPDGYFNTSSDAQGPADAELSSYNNQVNILTYPSQTRAGADTNRTASIVHSGQRRTSLPNHLNLRPYIESTRSTT
jgi:hypothetical protein